MSGVYATASRDKKYCVSLNKISPEHYTLDAIVASIW